MRSLVALMAGLMLTVSLVAAENVQSLIGDKADWSFWVKPEFKLTRMASKSAQMVGFQMGPALGRSLYLGIAGNALVSSISPDDTIYDDLKAFDYWTAGALIDFTLFSTKIVHGSAGCYAGYGRLSVKEILTDSSSSADLFVAEPNVNLLVNLSSTLELGVGAGYRFINGSNFKGLANSDLRDWTGNVFLRWTEGF